MRCTSSKPNRVDALRAGRAFCMAAVLLLCGTFSAAQLPTTPCALLAPSYQAVGGVARFNITLSCAPGEAGAKPFPLGVDVLVGLTVYAGGDGEASPMDQVQSFSKRVLDVPAELKAALGRATQSKGVRVAGAPRWIVLTDERAQSHDFAAKILRVDKAGTRLKLSFEDDEKLIAGKKHLLFAAWRASDRRPCKKDSRYARSGCKRDGYLLGDGSGVAPLAAYPGLEINHFEHPSGDAWTSERWVVERFR